MRHRTLRVALAVISAVAASIPTLVVPSARAGTGAVRIADPAVATAAADAFVAGENAALLKSPHDVIVRTGVSAQTGINYFSYERTHRGLPIIGGDLVVVTSPTGRVLNTAVAQNAVIDVAVTTPAVGADAATATAAGQLTNVESVGPARLVILAWGTPRPAWEIKLSGTMANGSSSVPTVYVDAQTGKIADSVDLVRDGTGNGFHNGDVTISTVRIGSSFFMSDFTRPGIHCFRQNGAPFTGPDDSWGNGSGTDLETACVDVLYGVQRTWDMLGSWLGRNGIDGNGNGFPARVGWDDVNARWNGSFTNFGHSADGQRQVTSIDIVAHEYGHAIFQTTPGGAGSGGENGGLNEGAGDIFGALAEHFADNPNDPPDFLIGEEADLFGGGPLRNMFDPSAVGDPSCWSTAIPGTEVHAAAGPLDHWFYLLSRGSNPIIRCSA